MDGSSFAEAWNFGPNDNDSRSVSCLVNELSKYWDEPEILEEKGFQPHEAQFLKLDISKTRNRLGWNPQLDFKKAISLTADWHLNVLKGVDPREATRVNFVVYRNFIMKKPSLTPSKLRAKISDLVENYANLVLKEPKFIPVFQPFLHLAS